MKELLREDMTIAEDIADFVAQSHSGETGIVYCRQKSTCDEVSAALSICSLW